MQFNILVIYSIKQAQSTLQLACVEAGVNTEVKTEKESKPTNKYAPAAAVDSSAEYMTKMCLDYMSMIEKAFVLTSELCQSCGLRDPSVASNSQMSRGVSAPIPSNDMVEESIAVESWIRFQELFKLISKISVLQSA